MPLRMEDRIKEAKLTAKDKAVLDYILQNQESCCFETASEIAQKLSVSPSSVVRISLKLGFENFSHLRRTLQEGLAKERDPGEVEIPYEKIRRYGGLTDEERIAAIGQNVLRNIQKDRRAIEDEKYIRAARILSESRNVYLAGFRCCAGFAESMGVMLSCVRPGVRTVTGRAPMVDSLVDLTEADALLLISFERYSSEAVFAARMGRESRCRMVAMTDSYASPIAQGAEVTLVSTAQNFSFYNSYASFVMAMEILVGLVSAHNAGQNEERLKKMEGYLEQNGQY